MPTTFLSEVILITVAAFIGGYVARSIKLPPVVGYIVSGIIFGAIGKSFFQSFDSLVVLSQFGVSLLLFTLGFEIKLDVLAKINKKVYAVGIAQLLVSILLVTPFLLLFGLALPTVVLLAILFSFSSTAVVVKILEEKGLLNDFPGSNVFILLLIQDIFVIPVIFLLPVLFSKEGFTPGGVSEFILGVAKPIIIFSLIFVFCKLFLSKILRFVFKYPSHELTILATIFTAAISIWVFTSVGLPSSIAAFLAGVLISEQGKNLAPLSEIRPFRDLFLVLFFVITGMLMSLPFFIQNMGIILIIAVGVLAIKFAGTYVVLRIFKYSPSSSVFISTHISNIGEFAPILAQIAFVASFISIATYDLTLAVFIVTLVAIPLWLAFARTGGEKFARTGLLAKVLPKDNIDKPAVKEYSNHVVICGHGRVGREVTSLLDAANIPYVVIDFNRRVINDLLKASKYAIYGDPTDVDIIKASFIDRAKVLVVAVPDSFSQKKIITEALKLNPKISILCRSHVEEDRYDLINIGVNSIVVPEFEAGVRLGSEVLDIFKVGHDLISTHVARLRRQNLL